MFIFDAFAEAQAAAESAGNPFLSLVPLLLIFLIFFFLVIRPQHKRVKLHGQMLSSLKKGDKVLTSSGIIGVINKIDATNSIIHLEVSRDVELKMTKSSISEKLDSVEENKSSKSKKETNVKNEKDVTQLGEAEND